MSFSGHSANEFVGSIGGVLQIVEMEDIDVVIEPFSCELRLEIKSGHITGGGLPNDAYVEVFVDNSLIGTTNTVAPGEHWNTTLVKYFCNVDNSKPIIVSLVVHKKRWTSHGFKIVGTVTFPLSDLFSDMEEKIGPIEKNYHLVSSKNNLTLGGRLLIACELIKIDGISVNSDTDMAETLANINTTDESILEDSTSVTESSTRSKNSQKSRPSLSGVSFSAEDDTLTYELNLTVKSAHVTGGGLPHDSFVEIRVEELWTEHTDTVSPGVDYNTTLKKYFTQRQIQSPILITFSLYKKRWTTEGFKLVGTKHLPLGYFFMHLEDEQCFKQEKSFEVAEKANLTLHGVINLEWIGAHMRNTDLLVRATWSKYDELSFAEQQALLENTESNEDTQYSEDASLTSSKKDQIMELLKSLGV